jgi:hypothetical protein
VAQSVSVPRGNLPGRTSTCMPAMLSDATSTPRWRTCYARRIAGTPSRRGRGDAEPR